MTRVAVMQPYFIPYAGYFRLFCDTDVFVVLDGVRFPKGGWVNRNRLSLWSGHSDWLTVPITRTAISIAETGFACNAKSQLSKQARRFPACVQPSSSAAPLAAAIISGLEGLFVDYLIRLLEMSCHLLSIKVPEIQRSSLMKLPPDLHGVDRVYEICRQLRAHVYTNPPGGADLYSVSEFARRSITLNLLPPYSGPKASILQRLHEHTAALIRNEIQSNL
jgi:hypothetical protein